MAGTEKDELSDLREELQKLKGRSTVNTLIAGVLIKALAEEEILGPERLNNLRTKLEDFADGIPASEEPSPHDDCFREGVSKAIGAIFDLVEVDIED